MPALYLQIAAFTDLLKRKDEDEFAEITQEEVDAAFSTLEDKVDNVAGHIKDLDADAAKFKAEAERLAAKAASLTARAKWFKGYLKQSLEAAKLKSVAAGVHKVRIQPNGQAAITFTGKVDDLARTHRNFVRWQEPVMGRYALDPDAVAAAIKAEPDLTLPEGLLVVRGSHIRIS